MRRSIGAIVFSGFQLLDTTGPIAPVEIADAHVPGAYRLQVIAPVNARFVELIRDIAAKKSATMAQVALAWVLAQGGNVFTIPGTRRVERLRENLGALKVSFSPEELADLRSHLPETAGARY